MASLGVSNTPEIKAQTDLTKLAGDIGQDSHYLIIQAATIKGMRMTA
jgi:hypothetical protein